MRTSDRIVVRLPLDELWDERGMLPARRGRWLGADDIRALLRAGPVAFVVASEWRLPAGRPLILLERHH